MLRSMPQNSSVGISRLVRQACLPVSLLEANFTLSKYIRSTLRGTQRISLQTFSLQRKKLSVSPRIPSFCVLVSFQAFSPYKLALVPREGDENRRESSAAAPARLTMTLLALDPGQAVAAQGQLAVALEDTGSCILRRHGDGERIHGD